jgi:hypothetical protein
MKEISDNVFARKKPIDLLIDALIDEETKKIPSLTVAHLSQELENMDEIQAMNLLSEHNQFKACLIIRKNKLLHNSAYGIDFVLDNLDGKQF